MFCAEVVVAALLAKYYGDSSATKAALPPAVAILVIVFICIFIASFAWSWGPLGWLVPSCVLSRYLRFPNYCCASRLHKTFQ